MFISLFKVDGGFTDWSSFSVCSTTCGDGVQKRQRSCTNPAPKNNGKECVGETSEEKECNLKECPSKSNI